MIKTYVKSALRNMKKQPLYSGINILGFAIGITCVIIITLWIQQQYSFDRFHRNYRNLYRIFMHAETNIIDVDNIIYVPTVFGPEFKEQFPEVTDQVRFAQYNESVFRYHENSFYEANGYYADNTVFQIFDFPLKLGNVDEALTDPYTIALNETLAKKYFGNEDPLGKAITIDDRPFTVTSVFYNVPENSHIQFDFLVSMPTAYEYMSDFLDWESNRVFTYLLLRENTEVTSLVSKMRDFISQNTSIWDEVGYSTELQPLSQVYLDRRYQQALRLINGDKRYLHVFMLVGIAILLISCINYVNLFKAQNLKRTKEIGMIRVFGATRKNVSFQFIFEICLQFFLATVMACIFFIVLFPLVTHTIGSTILIGSQQIKTIAVSLLCIFAFCVSIGIIPALYFARFRTSASLQDKIHQKGKTLSYKSSLVVFQFSISIILVAVALIALKQKNYLLQKDLGFDKEHLLYIPMQRSLVDHYDAFKQELLTHPGIKNIASKVGKPDEWYDGGYYWTTGMTYNEGPVAERIRVDYDFFETLDIKLRQGRFFSREHADDYTHSCILNQKAVDDIGFTDPVGKEVFFNDERRIVVGVIENILTKSLHEEVYPEIFIPKPSGRWSGAIILIKVSGNVGDRIKTIKETFNKYMPGDPFKYQFLNDLYGHLYQKEQRLTAVFKLFSLIAIVLACLGILGLAFYDTQERIKEIGVRKVNGAKVSEVMVLLNKDFVKWVVIAFTIAIPIAWYVMHKWLENFAYKTSLSWWVFALAGVLAFGIALLTVSWQSWRAATRNPVEALRYE